MPQATPGAARSSPARQKGRDNADVSRARVSRLVYFRCSVFMFVSAAFPSGGSLCRVQASARSLYRPTAWRTWLSAALVRLWRESACPSK